MKRIFGLCALLAVSLLTVGCAANSLNLPTTIIPILTPEATPAITTSPLMQSPAPTVLPTKDVSNIPEHAIFTDVISIEAGGMDEGMRYNYDELLRMFPMGPTDFYVDESGWIAILDSYNKRIAIFEGNEEVYSLDIRPSVSFPMYMCYYDGRFYILDYNMDTLVLIDYVPEDIGQNVKHKWKSYPMPSNRVHVRFISDLYNTPDGPMLISYDEPPLNYKEYDPEDDGQRAYICKNGLYAKAEPYIDISSRMVYDGNGSGHYIGIFKIGEQVWEFAEMNRDPMDNFYPIGCDIYGNIYGSFSEFVKDTSVFMFERTFRCYSPTGELLGIARIDYQDYFSYPNRDFAVMPDGTVYHLACLEDRVVVQEITLGRTYDSRMDELTQEAKEIAEGGHDEASDPNDP